MVRDSLYHLEERTGYNNVFTLLSCMGNGMYYVADDITLSLSCLCSFFKGP